MKISQIAVDVKAQEEGEWFDHPAFDGVRVCVRSLHSEAYTKKMAQLQNAVPRRKMKAGELYERQLQIARSASGALLAGFSGIEDESGSPVEYSASLAEEWSQDPQYRVFFEGVRELAEEVGVREQEAITEAVGNSPKGSASDSPTRRSTSGKGSS